MYENLDMKTAESRASIVEMPDEGRKFDVVIMARK